MARKHSRARRPTTPDVPIRETPLPDEDRPDKATLDSDAVGEESPGGTVATPDHDRVDEIGDALGVARSPGEEVRASSEILDKRDRERWKQER